MIKNHNPSKGTETSVFFAIFITKELKIIIPVRGRKLLYSMTTILPATKLLKIIIPVRGRKRPIFSCSMQAPELN